jgi:hypothetical protein
MNRLDETDLILVADTGTTHLVGDFQRIVVGSQADVRLLPPVWSADISYTSGNSGQNARTG